MENYFLGIHEYGDGHDAGMAVLNSAGEPVVILEGERFTKIKKGTNWIPDVLVDEVLKHIDPEKVVGMGIGQMGQVFERKTDLSNAEAPGHGFRHVADAGPGQYATPFRFAPLFPNLMRVTQMRHHLAHLHSAFCPSPFESALIVSVDGNGEFPEGIVVGQGTPDGCKILWSGGPKASLGTLYRVVGALYCGLPGSEGEGKAMALAAFGRPVYKEKLKKILMDVDPRSMAMTLRQPVDIVQTREGDKHLMALLEENFGPKRPMRNRPPDEMVAPVYADMAASLQKLVEEYILKLIEKWLKETREKNLCLAGGVSMNSAMNGEILRSGLIRDMFVQPASSDNGLALGAAYGALYDEYPDWRRGPHRFVMRHTFYGTRADADEIHKALSVYKLPVRRIEDPSLFAAQKLAAGHIVGWFQGRMEYGARALGNRSILSLATQVRNRDNINLKVKNREIWRPFAPATLKEKIGTYFELDRHEPFMTIVYKVKPEWIDKLAAVTHVDGTARVQSVDGSDNPEFYNLIKEVGRLTGVSVVLNTSLNGKRYPIVRTPGEAIALFLNSDMDCLVMENFVVEKGDKVKRHPYENDAISVIHELFNGEAYVADWIESDNAPDKEIKKAIDSAVKTTNGTFDPGAAASENGCHKLNVVLGHFEQVAKEVVGRAVQDYATGKFKSVKCIEFLEKKKHIRFTGIGEITWPLLFPAEIKKLGHKNRRITVSRACTFQRIETYQSNKRVVLWPVGGITRKVLANETALNSFKERVFLCVDKDQRDFGLNIPVIRAAEFRARLITGEIDRKDIDLVITSRQYLEEILTAIVDFVDKDNLYHLNEKLEFFKLD